MSYRRPQNGFTESDLQALTEIWGEANVERSIQTKTTTSETLMTHLPTARDLTYGNQELRPYLRCATNLRESAIAYRGRDNISGGNSDDWLCNQGSDRINGNRGRDSIYGDSNDLRKQG